METGPAHGALSGSPPTITYTPRTDYTGPDSFTFSTRDPHGATSTAVITITVQPVALVATQLVAHPVVARLQGTTWYYPNLSATLTRVDTQAPLAGRVIQFVVQNKVVCLAVTGTDGTAVCGGSANSALLARSYVANFAGDNDFSGSQGTGTVTRCRKRFATAGLAGLVLAASSLVLGAAPAHAAAPVLVNAAGTQWLESLAVPKDTNGERIWVTAIVKHDLGASVTGLAIDDDWNGTDNTATLAPDAVTATLLPGGPPTTPRCATASCRPTLSFSCGLFSGTRRTTSTLRMRAVLSDGQRTGVVSANVHSVENGQCLGATDYPYLFNQSQTATEVTPGSSVTFTFQGDDVDGTGGNDRLDKIRWRVRRLNDGAITQGPNNVGGLNDNTNINLAVTFPQRGRYVVEAELGGEDDAFGSFENGGQFFRIGAVDVNSSASSSPTVTLSPSPAVVERRRLRHVSRRRASDSTRLRRPCPDDPLGRRQQRHASSGGSSPTTRPPGCPPPSCHRV